MLRIKYKEYNSVLVSADSTQELAQTFMRFQEHYESPNPRFRNNIFTRGEYLYWYSQTYGGATYHYDWTGFNFPSYILEPFKRGLFDPLTDQEQDLVNMFKYRVDKFYIIGANDEGVIRHELSHAMYHYNNKYAQEINTTFDANKKKIEKISKYILKKGYDESVLYDELQAYITDNDNKYIMNNTPKRLLKKVNDLYKEYSVDTGKRK